MAKTISIRFYEELNDFLPLSRKKKPFNHTFSGTPGIKDIIESLGVPHGEVDLILADGKSVDFKYKPREAELISVYPQFESLDISKVTRLRPEPLRITRFILDNHLGKLCRQLRMLGFDCCYDPGLDDRDIISLALAENRIILTRDIPLLKHGAVTHGYWIRNDAPKKQLIEVVRRFDLFSKFKPLQRCLECNSLLKQVEKTDILELIEPETRKFFNAFFQCPNCLKVYWKGSHYDDMMNEIEILNK